MRRLVLFTVAALAVSTIAAARQPLPAHTLTGKVSDASGNALPGVTVALSRPGESGSVRTVVTNVTGDYRIEGVVPGVYVLAFRLPGFGPAIRDVEVGNGSDVFQYDVTLVSRLDGGPSGAPSAAQPSRRVICGMTVITPPSTDPGIRIPRPPPAGAAPVKPAIRAIQPTMCWEPSVETPPVIPRR